jgi:poly-gamma-glutamate synthesis protein (capsule biosynthesis protein)
MPSSSGRGGGITSLTGAVVYAALACSSSDDVAASRDEVTVLIVGDTMFDGELAAESAPPVAAILQPVEEYVRMADLALFNLETTLGAAGAPLEKAFTFRSSAAAADALAEAGFDVASVANNHVLDYGAEGLTVTLEHLTASGLAPVGVTEEGQPQTPLIVDLGSIRIGVLAYADGAEGYAYAEEFRAFAIRPAEAIDAAIARDLAALEPQVDAIVVSMHWGIENEGEVSERQRQLGQFLVDHGADLVMGHHPHVQQPSEWVGRSLIAYSLGNFVFGLWSTPEHLETRLLRVTLGKTGCTHADYLELETSPGTWAPTPVSGEFVTLEP